MLIIMNHNRSLFNATFQVCLTRAFLSFSCALGYVAALCAVEAVAADKPDIVERSAWGAKPAILERMDAQTAREIIIHHTGVKQQPRISLERKLRGLQGYSQNTKKWGDSPYHYYIGVSGRIGAARDVTYAGDTNTRYSVQDRIQVVVEGHFDRNIPTRGQLDALERLVVWLAEVHNIPANAISGHNDHAQTDCPGKKLKPFLTVLRERVASDATRGGE